MGYTSTGPLFTLTLDRHMEFLLRFAWLWGLDCIEEP